MSDEFPKMVYASNGTENVSGHMLKQRVVRDPEEQEAALSEGFVEFLSELPEFGATPRATDPGEEFIGSADPNVLEKRGPGRPKKEPQQ